MTFEDKLGHVGYVILVLGMFLIGMKQVWGWPIYIAGDVLWFYIGWRMRMTSIYLWQFVFVAVAARGWYNWMVT